MLTIDEVNDILDILVDELPQEIFIDLNGGISLLPEHKYDSHSQNHDLLIMGEYLTLGNIRTIIIYYGSFSITLGDSPKSVWIDQLRHVLRHEFLHHVESLAGEHSLEHWDKIQLERYQNGLAMEKEPWR